MWRGLTILAITLLLTGCYKPTPNDDRAISIAKEEVSMALCGDRSAECFSIDGAKVRVGERRSDKTSPITVTIQGINIKSKSDGSVVAVSEQVDEGIVVYDFDANSGKTYVKEISLWSTDGKRKIELCGHNYKFCRN